MSPVLIALLCVLIVPLLVATWRTSLLGLSCQGWLMAWVASYMTHDPGSLDHWITLFDLIVVRALWAPFALYGVMLAQNAPSRSDTLPPNLLSWTLALAAVLISFDFGGFLVAAAGTQQTLVTVAIAGILLGFLVLATQSGPFAQVLGALRIENAIALFELGGSSHHAPVPVRLGQLAVVAITVWLYRRYLRELNAPAPASAGTWEGPTL